LKKVGVFLSQELWQIDVDSLGAGRAFLVKFLRLLTVSARDFSEGLISLRAMSLVYTTLLSLVPLLAVSVSVLKAFGVHNQVEPALAGFLAPLGPKGAEITSRVILFVENLKVGVLGSVGLMVLIYTVISLIQKVESAFNEIWRVKRQRSFARRFSDYMSVILVGPVLIFAGLGLSASVASHGMIQRVLSFEPVGYTVFVMGKLLPFLVVCGAFTFIYMFVPSTRVHVRSALVGGLFAALLWQTAGVGFASFIVTTGRYAAIYSGFAILVLFMIWVYLSWLILLFGAKVAYYHQYPYFLHVNKDAILLSNRLEEKLALIVMSLVGGSHYRGTEKWDLEALLARLRLPLEPVQQILDRLESRGLILVTCDEPPRYLPARDIETISLDEVVNAVRQAAAGGVEAGERYLTLAGVDEVSCDVDGAIEGVLRGKTVRDLIAAEEKS
jgi:membrane protein